MPKYEIDTIPVWDAYEENGECPLCSIYRQCDEQFCESALGGSVMDSDTRLTVNRKGYCREHARKLFERKNKLGLALMAHTHLLDVLSELQRQAEALDEALDGEERASAALRAVRRVAKSAPSVELEKQLAKAARARAQTCILCDKLDDVMRRYVQTVVAMWKEESEFRKAFSQAKGYCLQHFSDLCDCGASQLSGRDQRLFQKALLHSHMEGLKRVAQELEWFTLKFDYRNQDKPWGSSLDAPERALNKLRGPCIPPHPEKKKTEETL